MGGTPPYCYSVCVIQQALLSRFRNILPQDTWLTDLFRQASRSGMGGLHPYNLVLA